MPEAGRWRGFLSLVYEKAADDNVFFLASGMTFGVLVAAIPFLFLLLSVAGLFLASQFEAPRGEVLDWFWRLVPLGSSDARAILEGALRDLADRAGSLGLVSGVAFVWFSTRLFGALRTVLGEVFDLGNGPGVIRGKAMDVAMVLVSTLLLCANIALSSFLGGLGSRILSRLGYATSLWNRGLGILVAFVFIYLMYLLIYKFVSLNRVRWSTASLAALIAALGFELLKVGFGWYVGNYAGYSTFFFAFATPVLLILSVYYGSVVFVLGGEVAQVWQLRRTRERQRELFEVATDAAPS